MEDLILMHYFGQPQAEWHCIYETTLRKSVFWKEEEEVVGFWHDRSSHHWFGMLCLALVVLVQHP